MLEYQERTAEAELLNDETSFFRLDERIPLAATVAPIKSITKTAAGQVAYINELQNWLATIVPEDVQREEEFAFLTGLLGPLGLGVKIEACPSVRVPDGERLSQNLSVPNCACPKFCLPDFSCPKFCLSQILSDPDF